MLESDLQVLGSNVGRVRPRDSHCLSPQGQEAPCQWTGVLNSDIWQCHSGEDTALGLLRNPDCLLIFCQQLSLHGLLAALSSLSKWFLYRSLRMTTEREREGGREMER